MLFLLTIKLRNDIYFHNNDCTSAGVQTQMPVLNTRLYARVFAVRYPSLLVSIEPTASILLLKINAINMGKYLKFSMLFFCFFHFR